MQSSCTFRAVSISLQAATTAALQAAAEQTRPNRGAAREARVDTLERLLGAVRRIDDSTTLTGILETLAQGAAVQTSRVVLLMVDGDTLKPWSVHGFAIGQEPRETPIGTSGLLTATVALKQTSFVKPLIAREIATPGFMQVPVGHTGLVVPLIVGGEVVAVLYADDVGATEVREDAPVWTEEIDLLVRHAAIRLENLTSVRTAEVVGHRGDVVGGPGHDPVRDGALAGACGQILRLNHRVGQGRESLRRGQGCGGVAGVFARDK